MLRPWIFLVLLVSLVVDAFELRRDSSGALVRWRSELELVIDDRLAAALGEPGAEEAVRAALDEVAGAAPGLALRARAGGPTAFGYDAEHPDANQSQVVALEDWPYDETALAVTLLTLNARTHELLDADVAFNTGLHRFRILRESVDVGAVGGERSEGGDGLVNDVQNTLTHELGHALGLLHNEDDSLVVMYPGAAPGETHKRHLATDDRRGLAALYDRGFAETVGDPASAASWGSPSSLGCASIAGPPQGLALLLALALGALAFWGRRRAPQASSPRGVAGRQAQLARGGRARRRLGAALGAGALCAAASAQASWPSWERALLGATSAGLGRVIDARSTVSAGNPGRIETELLVELEQCLLGACPRVASARVPGGRLGDVEQIVAHQPVPRVGDEVALCERVGKVRVRPLAGRAERDTFAAAAARFELTRVRSIGPQWDDAYPQAPTQTVESTP